MPEKVETVIIGAGVVGLAIARRLALNGHEVVVLERHGLIGSETSSRNSEVIHAGIYYPTGSLKARACVRGRDMLYRFCEDHKVPHAKIGKLIVATNEDQLSELEAIGDKAGDNGVDDLRFLSREETLALEPALNCHGALLSPSTGIIDSHAYMLALQGEMEDHGGFIALNTEVTALSRKDDGGFRVETSAEGGFTLDCRMLVVSAGLSSSRLMNEFYGIPDSYRIPRTYYAKGNYFRLAQGRAPFSRLIYPVPEPGGLGVHLTLDLGGQARFGPDVEWVETIDYTVDPARGERFYEAIRTYWPDLPDGALTPDYCGIRPKVAGPGEPAADFLVHGPKTHGTQGLVALYGIESPGLTSSLMIGEIVARELAG
ncbi:FAD-dependent oxidoreductase [Stappia sp. GBMRC 2046]|uniref:FAD-dependent oxidoreductase n=1 Tax=Stappia sediminis TaxID=2692190 RepID=A0A7X3S6S4_9HYPH|nr:NAD(P)/FAD-dependent oxidoreductase [Stappia sediminis]MXN64172.1 FAD-dependent oxidoreductase [Stappia sediminis]